jgi:hypothetical protein
MLILFGGDYEAEKKEFLFGVENTVTNDYYAINDGIKQTASGAGIKD